MTKPKILSAFVGKDLSCCEMVKPYKGMETGKIVTNTTDYVKDLVRRKVAVPRPMFYEKGTGPAAVIETKGDDEKILLGTDGNGEVVGSGNVPEGDEEPVKIEDQYSILTWNDLLKLRKERGIVGKINRDSIEIALRAQDAELAELKGSEEEE